jgi:acetyltransferase-like isoleucine patch superfamily enzyme
MTFISSAFLHAYRNWSRLGAKCFSLLVSGAFAHFGSRTVIMRPVRLGGEGRISVGNGVYIGAGSWLQTLPDDANRSVAIRIDDGVSVAGACVISAVRSVRLEEEVLLARNVYISDHIHRYTDTDKAILRQGVDKIRPVLIRRGAWLGQNVVVCPGVTIGRGSVVGANSVVTRDIPDYVVAAGSPARIIKQIEAAGVPVYQKV